MNNNTNNIIVFYIYIDTTQLSTYTEVDTSKVNNTEYAELDHVYEPVPNEPIPHECKQNIVNNTYEVHNDQYTLNIYNGYEVSETEVFGDNDKVCEPVPNEPIPHECKQNIVNNTYEVHNDQYTLKIYNGYEVSETEVFGNNE